MESTSSDMKISGLLNGNEGFIEDAMKHESHHSRSGSISEGVSSPPQLLNNEDFASRQSSVVSSPVMHSNVNDPIVSSDLPPLSTVIALMSMGSGMPFTLSQQEYQNYGTYKIAQSEKEKQTQQEPVFHYYKATILDLREVAINELNKLKTAGLYQESATVSAKRESREKARVLTSRLVAEDDIDEDYDDDDREYKSTPKSKSRPIVIRYRAPQQPVTSNNSYADDSDSSESGSTSNPNTSSKKRFRCTFDGCNKGFPSRAHLVRHSRVHTGERPYQCPLESCGKFFSRQDNMLQHYRSHGNKPYKARSGFTSSAPESPQLVPHAATSN